MKQISEFYLGVEGGATKSTAILADGERILAQRTGKSLSYHNIGEAAVKKNLQTLLSPFLKKGSGTKLYAVLGFAGLDTKRDKEIYRKIVGSVLPKNSVFEVVNDAHIALEARCPGEQNRILVISGTGSTVLGQSKNKEAKSIGWDFLFGDEGSGYEIGTKVLKSAIQSWDGRIQKTVLEDLVLKEAHCKTMEEFMPKIYHMFRNQPGALKHSVADFGKIIDQALEQNDWRAREIRDEAVAGLLQGVRAVAQRLDIQDARFCIGLMGSVWKMPGLKEQFKKAVGKEFPLALFSEKQEPGAWGAVMLAKKLD